MNNIWILLVGVGLIILSILLLAKGSKKPKEKMDLFTQITTNNFVDED